LAREADINSAGAAPDALSLVSDYIVTARILMEHTFALPGAELEEAVKNIGIPSCPAILTKLLREMREDDPDLNKVGKLIGSDVSLAAAMLKTVNSPFYGLRSKVSSVHQALSFVGLQNAAQLVTGLLLRNAFQGGASHAMEEFWESSSAIALMNAGLARKLKIIDREEAYTFALFRDSGALAMLAGADKYRPILPGVSNGKSATETESEHYGIDHTVTGYYLTKSWLMPEHVCEAVLWHHQHAALRDGKLQITPSGTKHIAIALASEWLYVTGTLGGTCEEWREGGAFALETLGHSEADLRAAVEDLANDA
jgi:HD-like signal output (HDOD) protein